VRFGVIAFCVAMVIISMSTNRRRIAEWRQRTEGKDPDSPAVTQGPRLVGTKVNRNAPAYTAVVLCLFVGLRLVSVARNGVPDIWSPISLITVVPTVAAVYLSIKYLRSPRRWR